MDNLKMDINFLDKPLYFLNLKSAGKAFVWEDIDGYIYRSAYNLPDYLDMLILLYLTLKSQIQNYSSRVILTKYEILKGCDLDTGKKHYDRLEESLKRWTNVTIEFDGIFYDNKEYISMAFGILDSYKISIETKKVHVRFSEDWLLKVKESSFYKYLNFEFYKNLKKPVSRRLYELMLPKCYDGKDWYISLINLGNRLGVAKRKVKTKQGIKEVMYASDVLVAIKPGFKEINQLCMVPDICHKLKINANELFSLSHKITGEKQKRIIYIKKELVNSASNAVTLPAEPLEFIDFPNTTIPSSTIIPEKPKQNKPMSAKLSIDSDLPAELQEKYLTGIAWIKEVAPDFNFKSIEEIKKDELAEYFPKLYVKFEHTSKKGIGNPAGFILECIQNKWEIKSKKERLQEKNEQNRKETAKIKKNREEIAKQIMIVIEQKGGLDNVVYDEKRIVNIESDGVILDDGQQGCFSFWEHLSLEKFMAKNND